MISGHATGRLPADLVGRGKNSWTVCSPECLGRPAQAQACPLETSWGFRICCAAMSLVLHKIRCFRLFAPASCFYFFHFPEVCFPDTRDALIAKPRWSESINNVRPQAFPQRWVVLPRRRRSRATASRGDDSQPPRRGRETTCPENLEGLRVTRRPRLRGDDTSRHHRHRDRRSC